MRVDIVCFARERLGIVFFKGIAWLGKHSVQGTTLLIPIIYQQTTVVDSSLFTRTIRPSPLGPASALQPGRARARAPLGPGRPAHTSTRSPYSCSDGSDKVFDEGGRGSAHRTLVTAGAAFGRAASGCRALAWADKMLAAKACPQQPGGRAPARARAHFSADVF